MPEYAELATVCRIASRQRGAPQPGAGADHRHRRVARCADDGPTRPSPLRPDRRGLRPLVGAGPRAGASRCSSREFDAGARGGREPATPRRRDRDRHARAGRARALAGRRTSTGIDAVGGDVSRWPTARRTTGCRPTTGAGSDRRSRSPTSCRSTTARSTPRSRRSSSSSSRTARAALREVRRVLRPGGTLAYVTWLRRTTAPFAPDRIFDEVLDEFGFDPPESGRPAGRHASVERPPASCAAPGSATSVRTGGEL